MARRLKIIAALVVTALVLSSCLLVTASVGDKQPSADFSESTEKSVVTNEPSGESVTSPPRPQPTVNLPALSTGAKPPQFIVVSFDGGVEDRNGLMKHYLDLAQQVGGRFSFYLSGVYLIPDDATRRKYQPPKQPPGTSAIDFGNPDFTNTRIQRLAEAYDAGHEIGTHFMGHFCGPKGVNRWTRADWTSEIKQYNDTLDNWRTNNPQATEVPPLPFDSSIIKGGRTPCLEGQRNQMYPAFKQAGYLYDTSNTGVLAWPKKNKYGLWDIPLQTIKLAGYNTSVLSMDYNFMYNQNRGSTTANPATCQRIEQSAYQTYRDALDAVLKGNRAPLILGAHMNNWVCGAYTNALSRFIRDTYRDYPDVRFISTLDLVHWLDAQDPTALKSLHAAQPTQQ